MSAADIDAYLAGVDEPARSTLEQLRSTILAVVPDAEQVISYGAPAFAVDGAVVAGFAAYRRHLSYLPHSGSVLTELADELGGYAVSKGALRFAIDQPLPTPLVERLIAERRRELTD
ncbi:MAG: DUF1801 domain-containing protein [Acidimicrobiales bacterium]